MTSFASAFRSRTPALVERLVPFDPLASVIALDRRVAAAPTRMLAPILTSSGRESLQRQVLNPRALRLLMLAAAARNDSGKAVMFANLSERTSRRDLGVQLWLIEAAVQRNDVRGALRHYDRALRVKLAAYPVLFQVLLAALSDPEIRAAMVPYVAQDPRWIISFLLESAGSDPTAADTARLLIASSPNIGKKVREAISPQLMTRLIKLGDGQLAERYLNVVERPGLGLVRAVGLTRLTTDARWGPFAWQALQNTTSGATVETLPNDRRRIRTYVGPQERQIVLSRVIGLAPGSYSWVERSQVEVGDAGSSVNWRMRCVQPKNSRLIWQVAGGTAAVQSRPVPGPTVPADCILQIVELELFGGEGQQGLEMLVNDIQFLGRLPSTAGSVAAAEQS